MGRKEWENRERMMVKEWRQNVKKKGRERSENNESGKTIREWEEKDDGITRE